jgi:hypothetical protein
MTDTCLRPVALLDAFDSESLKSRTSPLEATFGHASVTGIGQLQL